MRPGQPVRITNGRRSFHQFSKRQGLSDFTVILFIQSVRSVFVQQPLQTPIWIYPSQKRRNTTRNWAWHAEHHPRKLRNHTSQSWSLSRLTSGSCRSPVTSSGSSGTRPTSKLLPRQKKSSSCPRRFWSHAGNKWRMRHTLGAGLRRPRQLESRVQPLQPGPSRCSHGTKPGTLNYTSWRFWPGMVSA